MVGVEKAKALDMKYWDFMCLHERELLLQVTVVSSVSLIKWHIKCKHSSSAQFNLTERLYDSMK